MEYFKEYITEAEYKNLDPKVKKLIDDADSMFFNMKKAFKSLKIDSELQEEFKKVQTHFEDVTDKIIKSI
jgi:phosphomevalonate kinase